MSKIYLTLFTLFFCFNAFGAEVFFSKDKSLKLELSFSDEIVGRVLKKTKRFTSVTVTRNGESFKASCDPIGTVNSNLVMSAMDCGIYEESVSNDDDETLSFRIAFNEEKDRYNYLLDNIGYTGDYTPLGEQVAILLGNTDNSNWEIDHINIDLEPDSPSNSVVDINQDPIAFVKYLNEVVRTFLNKEIYYKKLDATAKIQQLRYSIKNDFTMGFYLTIIRGEEDFSYAPGKKVSLLNTQGDFTKGIVSKEELTKRISKILGLK